MLYIYDIKYLKCQLGNFSHLGTMVPGFRSCHVIVYGIGIDLQFDTLYSSRFCNTLKFQLSMDYVQYHFRSSLR